MNFLRVLAAIVIVLAGYASLAWKIDPRAAFPIVAALIAIFGAFVADHRKHGKDALRSFRRNATLRRSTAARLQESAPAKPPGSCS